MSSTSRTPPTISIHALCEEGDAGGGHDAGLHHISIHALCEEGDSTQTPSGARFCNFYPRPLRGGRPLPVIIPQCLTGISIHALCEEGDSASCAGPAASGYFYPRPLRGGRHGLHPSNTDHKGISIHALCEEGDCTRPWWSSCS